METKYGGAEATKFITNLSFITSKGKWGDNIMTAEWVHHISYNPGLIMVNVHDFDATSDNILESKEFAVNLAAIDQAGIVMIAGGSSGKKANKVAALKDMGFKFHKAKNIDVQLVNDSVLSLECKLIKHEKVGDHMIFIGEVVASEVGTKDPLVFRAATGIFKLGEPLPHDKKIEEEERVAALLEKHKK